MSYVTENVSLTDMLAFSTRRALWGHEVLLIGSVPDPVGGRASRDMKPSGIESMRIPTLIDSEL